MRRSIGLSAQDVALVARGIRLLLETHRPDHTDTRTINLLRRLKPILRKIESPTNKPQKNHDKK